jgi:TatD DNase family protein
MVIDSHCHLQHTRPDTPLGEFLAEISGELRYCIDICIAEDEIRRAEEVKYPSNVLRAAGVYPEFAARAAAEPAFLEEFERKIRSFRPHALGEVGMDYYHPPYGTPVEQERLFRRQIELALTMDLPLIIHSRDAFEDTLRILSGYRFPRGLILHCFGYGPGEAEAFLAAGYTLSFAGNLTFPKSVNLHEAARLVPTDRLLFETDSPYLTPVPLRGKKNEPPNVVHTYRFFAGLRGMDFDELAGVVERNFLAFFPFVR